MKNTSLEKESSIVTELQECIESAKNIPNYEMAEYME